MKADLLYTIAGGATVLAVILGASWSLLAYPTRRALAGLVLAFGVVIAPGGVQSAVEVWRGWTGQSPIFDSPPLLLPWHFVAGLVVLGAAYARFEDAKVRTTPPLVLVLFTHAVAWSAIAWCMLREAVRI